MAHTCPDCGQACYCSGDIEDHDTGEEYIAECTCCDGSDAAGDDLEPFDPNCIEKAPARTVLVGGPSLGLAAFAIAQAYGIGLTGEPIPLAGYAPARREERVIIKANADRKTESPIDWRGVERQRAATDKRERREARNLTRGKL